MSSIHRNHITQNLILIISNKKKIEIYQKNKEKEKNLLAQKETKIAKEKYISLFYSNFSYFPKFLLFRVLLFFIIFEYFCFLGNQEKKETKIIITIKKIK